MEPTRSSPKVGSVDLEEVLEQLPVGEPLWVEDDLDRLRVTPRALLGRVLALAAGPSLSGGDDSVGVAQQLLHDPGAASREHCGLGVVAHRVVLSSESR